MTAPDSPGQITGWRAWSLDTSGPEARLASVVHAGPWPVRAPLTAECRAALRHDAPRWDCQCGIYAARDVTDAAYHVELPSRRDRIMPIGLVSAWGEVVEAERGWRVSRAYPLHIYLPLRDARQSAQLEAVAWDLTSYGVPVEILDCTHRSVTGALRAATRFAARPFAPMAPVTTIPSRDRGFGRTAAFLIDAMARNKAA